MTVTCRSVTKRFGDFVALDGVDLDVYENEILGIIGPNGAGKTTLLNCLEGLDEPTSGCVEVLGLDPIKDSRQLIARMGVQLQQAALLPRIKVSEALELFLRFTTRQSLTNRCSIHWVSVPKPTLLSKNCPAGSVSAFSSRWRSFMNPSCCSWMN